MCNMSINKNIDMSMFIFYYIYIYIFFYIKKITLLTRVSLGLIGQFLASSRANIKFAKKKKLWATT